MIKIGARYKSNSALVKINGQYKYSLIYTKSNGQYVQTYHRWGYNFDGVNDRGQLQFRAINPDGDIDIEWRSGPTVSFATSRTIVSQTLTTVGTNQEFFMFVATNGNLAVRVGGLERGTNPAIVYQPNTKYRWRLQGTVINFWINDVLQPAMSLTRGTAREPAATTQIGSTANTFFYLGELYDVRINGVLWPIADRNQTIQLPSPNGLGAELITQTILENPVVKGSQWSYLGDGRWQYIGDGTQNGLIFIGSAATPTDMFIEFEVESFTGAGNMRITSVVTGFGDRLFNTTGVKRFFFTNDTVPNIQFERNVAGAACSCVIKNISFKPLYAVNATELVTNGDFSSGTSGWSAFAGGSLAVNNSQGVLTTSGAGSRFERGVTLEAGSYYQVSMDVVALTGSTLARLTLMRGAAGNYSTIGTASLSAMGKISFIVLAPAADSIISIGGDNVNSGTITVDNISVRKLDSLCNPLTLINTNTDRWQGASF